MDIPLFPLNVVLFPDGVVPLRIFETRYVDMVRDCMREASPFGVCLIARGQEVGETAQPESIGCLATIDIWDMPHLGLLHVRASGGERFRIETTARQQNGLLRGKVDLLEPDEDSEILDDHRPCVDLLRRIIGDLEAKTAGRGAEAKASPSESMPFLAPYQLDSSVWVGNRLCEVLPIPLKAKQRLMELDDARTRLDIVARYLKQHAVLK
jgi:uncharacterized protein